MTTRQDERGNDDMGAYCNLPRGPDMVNFLAHQQQAPPQQLHHPQQQGQGPMIWQPAHQQHMGAQFQPLHHQGPPPPPQAQQQLFNEYLYNLAYSPPTGQPETYSVLPVGHGNFLKVYHCPENLATAPPVVNENNPAALYTQPAGPGPYTHINVTPLTQHHQAAGAVQQAQPPPPTQAQFYELFATKPLLPKPDMNIAVPTQQQQAPQPQQIPHQPPTFRQFEEPLANMAATTPSNNSNLFINNLVNNWSPNLTGSPYIQFGGDTDVDGVTCYSESSPVHQPTPLQAPQQQYNKNIKASSPLPPQSPVKTVELNLSNNSTTATTATAINKANIIIPGLSEGKKRIVAEVKPMPMSYSDVLSKGTLRTMTNAGNPGEARTGNGLDANVMTRRQGKEDIANNPQARAAKRSPMHDVKDSSGGLSPQQMTLTGASNSNGNRSKKRAQVNAGNQAAMQKPQPQPTQQPQPQQQSVPVKSVKAQPQLLPEKKRNSSASAHPKGNNNGGCAAKANDNKTTTSSATAVTTNPTMRKVNNNIKSNNNSNGNYANVNSSNAASAGSSNNNNNNSGNNSSSSTSKRYYNSSNANLNSNSGYSYSSKRNRGNAYSNSNSPAHASTTPNRNYELAKRILHTWWIYTLKLLTWLFYLVYDIVVLGCSMAYERLTTAYVAGIAYAQQLHKELKQNSGKPSLWWRNYWRRFDARFKKNSRWAIWRRFCKRKPPESTGEAFKTGRLPQTGEEAMYSLLNCKGKDAYSILGVPPNSPQEQIRKHYKKIAVLVHPDKNKQAGAEEAFKVLQRAFELIGEPENRLAYDQSIAEALHAEKAWTELHELLAQLQTKMTEAANTIRCSTCSLRHPRKLTDRAHYAARECASCKIRHSAKDGDIWAETSMLGLRWKYLALMDGKVYDITEWANCQKGALSHLEPNSHMVQYRIVRGAQQQQQQQQQQQHHQQPHQHAHHERGAGHHHGGVGGVSEATLHEFLDNLYSGQHPGSSASAPFASSARRRTRRN